MTSRVKRQTTFPRPVPVRHTARMSSARRCGLVLVLLAVAACSGAGGRPPEPTPCEAAFSAARCSNMTDYAARKLGTARDGIVAIAVLPDPTPEVRDGVTILRTTSGAAPVEVIVTLRDGTAHEVSMDCFGLPALQCQDEPRLQAASVTMGGYFDTPCTGEPPIGCASPVPSPDPEALAAAVALRVARLDIPIDHDGRYEVRAGEASLPNGILAAADFGFASAAWPNDFTIADGTVVLEVRSLDDPTLVFTNIHEHPRVEGVERVVAVLVFDAVRHEAGAVLSIRRLVVR